MEKPRKKPRLEKSLDEDQIRAQVYESDEDVLDTTNTSVSSLDDDEETRGDNSKSADSSMSESELCIPAGLLGRTYSTNARNCNQGM